jgi:TatD DNase family protein
MTPTPFRGKRNRSEYIEFIIDKIAEIRNVDANELNAKINSNIRSLLNLGK